MALISSPPSATASVTVTATGWWLKDPIDPTVNAAIVVVGEPSTHRDEQAGVFYPLGSTRPVVVADAMTGADGALKLLTTTPAAYAALVALLTRQRTLLLQSPFGEQWYVRLIGSRPSTLKASLAAAPYREYQFSYVEVAAP